MAHCLTVDIVVVGATGNVGRKIADEAVARGHQVTAVARNVETIPSHDRRPVAADAADTDSFAAALTGHELVISALRWDNNDVTTVLDGIRRSGVTRVIVVVGAGSLLMPDGRPYYQHLLDRGIDPPSSKAALAAFEHLRGVDDLDWTAVSPAAEIFDGERTGVFRLGGDAMVNDSAGHSRISQQDYAIAVLDEAEHPNFVRRRFTVAY